MDYELPNVAVPWFDIDSLDEQNLRAHLEQTPAQQAYIGFQLAEAEKAMLEAEDRYKQVRGQQYLTKRQDTVERLSKKGGREEIDVTDTLAKYLVECDPQVITAAGAYNQAKYTRDIWRGYAESMRSKVSLLLCLSGITRDEMAAMRK